MENKSRGKRCVPSPLRVPDAKLSWRAWRRTVFSSMSAAAPAMNDLGRCRARSSGRSGKPIQRFLRRMRPWRGRCSRSSPSSFSNRLGREGRKWDAGDGFRNPRECRRCRSFRRFRRPNRAARRSATRPSFLRAAWNAAPTPAGPAPRMARVMRTSSQQVEKFGVSGDHQITEGMFKEVRADDAVQSADWAWCWAAVRSTPRRRRCRAPGTPRKVSSSVESRPGGRCVLGVRPTSHAIARGIVTKAWVNSSRAWWPR